MGEIVLRPYQEEAVTGIAEALQAHRSTLLVLPTGCGKTTVFLDIARRFQSKGRIMVFVHRGELVWQAAKRWEDMSGESAGIEMAELVAAQSMWDRNSLVVATSQSLNSKRKHGKRVEKFDPSEFSLVIVDEAHRAVANGHLSVLDHFKNNPDCKFLGVTATPDRADEKALGKAFESVAYTYELPDAVRDGWLVPIEQFAVAVKSLDFSSMRTTGGDLNGKDLNEEMEREEILHGVASSTLELGGGKRTLVFTASVAQAERLAEIFNRHQDGCADWICGKTEKEDRRRKLADFATGKYQYLCNVGVLTEGYDNPGIECVVMARPTKSRCLYAQCIGRGTRPLPGIVDGVPEAWDRCLSILTSRKPALTVLDFVGNAGRHKLVSAADILGGNYDDKVVERAKRNIEKATREGEITDAMIELAKAERELKEEAERERRKHLVGRAQYSASLVNPFDLFDIRPHKERGWNVGRMPTAKQLEILSKFKVPAKNLTFTQASQLLDQCFQRAKKHLCTFKQAQLLAKYGHDPKNVTFEQASQIITSIAEKEGWRKK